MELYFWYMDSEKSTERYRNPEVELTELLSKKMKPFVEVHYYREKGKKSNRGNSFFYEIYTGLVNGRTIELIDKDAVIGEDMEKDAFKEFVVQKAFSLVENNDECWVRPLQSLEDEKINHFFEKLEM